MLTNLMIRTRIGLDSLAARVSDWKSGESGQTFVEYALIIGGVSITLLVAFLALTDSFDTVIGTITDCLDDYTQCPGVST
jgi:Flp pilus assembly pilin Flp